MKFLFGAAAFAALAQAASIPAGINVVHEKREYTPRVWQKRHKVPEEQVLPMRIGLRQSNLDKGHDLLMDVSDPESPNYGKHYTPEEVAEIFAPSRDTVDFVNEWLAEAGLQGRVSQSANKGWLQFDASTSEAERLLNTEFHYFEHVGNGDHNIACDEYHVPEHITEHIDYVTPGVRLLPNGSGARKAKRDGTKKKRGFGNPPSLLPSRPLPQGASIHANVLAAGAQPTGCDLEITPQCIQFLYGIPAGNKSAAGNTLGIYESGDFYSQDDLDEFWTNVYPIIPAGTGPKLVSVDGGQAPVSQDQGGGESALDFQIAYPIIWPQNATLYQVDDLPNTDPFDKIGLFNTFLDSIDGSYCKFSFGGETGDNSRFDATYPDNRANGFTGQRQCGVYKAPNVLSISYGTNEADLTPAYQKRQCQEWMKLGLQGTTVVVASGDSGVGGRMGQGGHSAGCLGDNQTIFNPDYPGTCPYLLLVGGTTLPQGSQPTPGSEVAVSSYGSGGGFSNLYPQPSYQKSAVDAYLNTNAPAEVKAYPSYSVFTKNQTIGQNGGIYNRDGRAYPDVSALGDNIEVVIKGGFSLQPGTSASAPLWAAILNRINEERIAKGKKVIGFVNPTLYQHPEVFNDVTSGNNAACSSDGFVAAKGWDPVTGLGTPKYAKLLSLFMSLK